MSARILGAAFYVPTDQSSKLVLLALADHANDDGTGARPGLSRLGVKTGLSRRAVQRALAHLEEHGLINACNFRKGGKGRATNWSINVAAVRMWADLYDDDPAEYARLTETVSQVHPFGGNSVICDRKGCHLKHERVSPVTPQPSEPSINRDGKGVAGTPFPVGGLVAEFKRRIGEDPL
mgnify:CR=1 FL=1